jgi:predicted aldo/keto reductase-like oxidoreductase
MSTMAQVEDNLRSADLSRPQAFGPAEQELIAQAREMYAARTAIPCTKCNYCMPCPNGVNIPGNFEFYNFARLFDDVQGAKFRYQVFLTEAQRSGSCIACGVCEGMCPQEIPISEWMPKVSELLA